MTRSNPYTLLPLALLLAGLTGCGGGGGGSTAGTGSLTVAITDAPVDEADAVWVEFTGAEINPANGDSIHIDYATVKRLNLLALTGGVTETLLDGEVLPAGQYNWIRLKVNAEADSVFDSYIVINGAQYELRVPSGSQRGLQLNRPFTVPDGGNAAFTVDFDLRKSVHERSGNIYMLRPTLRIVDNSTQGAVAGMIANSTLTAECLAGDSAAVYVFEGAGATPDDVDGTDPEPISTAIVDWEAGDDDYTIAFLEAGDYTAAFTCDAGLDDPTQDDSLAFTGTTDFTVTAGQTTQVDF